MDTLDLSYFIKTKAQANDFSSRIASISGKIYQTNFNLETELMNEIGIQKKDKFLVLIQNNKIDTTSNTALRDFLTSVLEKTKSLPVLEMTLAFEPNDKTLQTLSEWFLINVKRHILFEIRVDPKLIAGTTLSFNGKYTDCSITSKVIDIIQGEIKTLTTPLPAHQTTEHMSMGR